MGSMGESTGGALNATAECTGELLGCEVGCDLQCHVFTSKYLRTQIIAEWFSQALAEETYVPRALGGTGIHAYMLKSSSELTCSLQMRV